MNSDHEIAQRKRQLLAEGAVYRASLAASMQEARQNLRADSLASRASGFALSTVLGMVKRKGALASGIGMQGWLPFAIEAFSLVSKRPFLKKMLRIVAVVAGTAGAVNVLMRNRKSSERDVDQQQGVDETG